MHGHCESELTAEELAIVEAIVEGPGGRPGRPGPCWTPRDRLELTWSPESIDGLIVARGPRWAYLVEWKLDRLGRRIAGGPLLTLSPWAAEHLQLELSEVGLDETPVWVERGAEPRQVRIPRHAREVSLPYPHRVIDPAPGPLEIVLDEWSGKPVMIFGQLIRIDRRIRPPAKPSQRTG